MKLLSFAELKTVKGVPYSRPHLYRLIKAGKFPTPIKIGENRVGFSDSEIDAHLEALAAERDKPEAA